MYLGATLSVETHPPTAAPPPGETQRRFCPRCAAVVTMVGPREAARLDFTDERTILLWAEAGTLHSRRTPGGALLVCLDSLLR